MPVCYLHGEYAVAFFMDRCCAVYGVRSYFDIRDDLRTLFWRIYAESWVRFYPGWLWLDDWKGFVKKVGQVLVVPYRVGIVSDNMWIDMVVGPSAC